MQTDSSGLAKSRKPQLTLAFEQIGLDIGEFCIPEFTATIRLTAPIPNWRGFVVDTQEFTAQVARLRASNSADAQEKILELSKKLMGTRLVAINGEVQKEGGADRVCIAQGTPLIDTSAYSRLFEKASISTKLIDDSVCGGFDGRFMCDVWVGEQGFSGSDVLNEIKVAFAKGVYKASCEELALGVCHVVQRRTYPECKQIMSRVYNQSGYAEVVWVQGMDALPFPKIATPAEIKASKSLNGKREILRC